MGSEFPGVVSAATECDQRNAVVQAFEGFKGPVGEAGLTTLGGAHTIAAN